MEYVMIAAEIVIGLVGVVAILTAHEAHDKVHGLFVLLLCAQELCDHLLGIDHIITHILAVFTALCAIFVIVLAFPKIMAIINKRNNNSIED